jgi:hypothetical protein
MNDDGHALDEENTVQSSGTTDGDGGQCREQWKESPAASRFPPPTPPQPQTTRATLRTTIPLCSCLLVRHGETLIAPLALDLSATCGL